MEIATSNINNVTKRFGNLARWLATAAPDVVCLQELKTEHNRFPAAALERFGYSAVWRGERSWNGVAILSRSVRARADPRCPSWRRDSDRQSRYIEAAVNGVVIGCLYLPNGNPQPGPKFDYKLAWFERLIAHAAALRKANVPAVLAGDFNVVPTDFEIYSTRSWENDALVQPEPRAAYRAS